MAKYIIHKTNPFTSNTAFSISEFTSSGPTFPTVNLTGPGALSIDTTLFLFGKGQPNYGEQLQENLVRLLENFAGPSEPVSPTVGQIWFREITVIRTNSGNDWWEWDKSSSTWIPFVPQSYTPANVTAGSHGDYFLDTTSGVLYRKVLLPQHPLSGSVVKIVHNIFPTVTNPNTENIKPIYHLVVWNGDQWIDVNNVITNSTANTIFYDSLSLPEIGNLWFDTSEEQLKIYTSSGWTSVAEKYLPLAGGTLNSGANIILSGGTILGLPATPTDPTEAVSKDYVDSLVFGAVPSISLNDLNDVNVTGASANTYLKFNGTNWFADVLELNDLNGVTITTTELNTLSGITGNVQSQLNDKISRLGDSMSGILDMQNNRIIQVSTPSLGTDAVNKNYVDNYVASYTASQLANYLPLTGGNLTGTLDLGNNNITSVADPINPTDATNRQWVESYVTSSITSLPIGLDNLNDVTLTSPTGGQLLVYDTVSTQWINRVLVTSDISDLVVGSAEINQLVGVTDNVQNQLDNKASVDQVNNKTTVRKRLVTAAELEATMVIGSNPYVDNGILASDYQFNSPFKFRTTRGDIEIRVFPYDDPQTHHHFVECKNARTDVAFVSLDPAADSPLVVGTTYTMTVDLQQIDRDTTGVDTTTTVSTISISITPTATMSYQNVVDEINNQLTGTGITAYILGNNIAFVYDKFGVLPVGSTGVLRMFDVILTDGASPNGLIVNLGGTIQTPLRSTSYLDLDNSAPTNKIFPTFIGNAGYRQTTNTFFSYPLYLVIQDYAATYPKSLIYVEFIVHGRR